MIRRKKGGVKGNRGKDGGMEGSDENNGDENDNCGKDGGAKGNGGKDIGINDNGKKLFEEERKGCVMSKPAWIDNKVATIFGVIFIAPYVIFAYRVNTYTLRAEPMSGGRIFWRMCGWSLLCCIPFVGLIYGLVKIDDILRARNRVFEIMKNHQ